MDCPSGGLRGASGRATGQRLFPFMIEQPAIQNLDYLRQLILETRAAQPLDDDRLRMLNGYGMGTDAITVKQGDRQ